MASTELSSSLAQSIDLTLNKLMDFRQNLRAKMVIHPINGDYANINGVQGIDAHLVKVILEENPEIKKERDSAKFFQLAISKLLNKIIEEQIQKFYLSKDLEKEMILLEDRLKGAQQSEEDRNRMHENLIRLNSLESLERAKMLMMLNALQTLNDRYLYLEGEKQQSIKVFTQSMEKTLESLIKKDGMPLTTNEKKQLNQDLSQSEIALIQELMEKEYNKLEGRTFNDMLRSLGPKTNGGTTGLREGGNGFFAAYGGSENDIFNKVVSSAEFKERHAKLVVEQLSKYDIDSAQAKNLAEVRAEKIAKSPEARAVAEVSHEQKLVQKQSNQIIKNNQALNNSVDLIKNKREQKLASAYSKKQGMG